MKALTARTGGVATCLAAILLFAGTARAQGFEAPWRGIYLGGGGNFSDVSVEVGSACYDYDCWWGEYDYYEDGDGDYGYALHVGWRVYDYVALEVGYVETGDIRWEEEIVYFPEFNDYYNNRVDFSAQIVQASVLGILPYDRFELYLRLGAGFWDADSAQRLDQSFGTDVVNRSVSDSGTGFLGGVGFGVTLAKGLHVRFEAQSTTIDEDMLNTRDDAGIDVLLLEAQYRFGAGKATDATTTPATR
jgi:OmpA-like transmembrane domain